VDETNTDASLVETPEALEALATRWHDEGELAFDLEGDGLYRYRSQLCAVQLATRAGDIAILDTLAATHRAPLARLLGPEGPRKTVHDVSYDGRLLAENDILLGNVFDTSVAARFLDEPATGLSSLVAKYLDVTLPKGKQKANWGKRPFGPDDLGYLAADVRHLLELGDRLEAAVEAAGITPEVRAETDYLLHRALTDEPDTRPPWVRIKGRDDLDDVGLAILREVAQVREDAAASADVPPFTIIGNRELLEMAQRRPTSRSELSRIRATGRGRARRYGRDFIDAVVRGQKAGQVPADELAEAFPEPPPREERELRQKLRKKLSTWRKAEAAKREVNSQVVLPGHCLEALTSVQASRPEDLAAIPGFGEFRVERYGEELMRLLSKAGR